MDETQVFTLGPAMSRNSSTFAVVFYFALAVATAFPITPVRGQGDQLGNAVLTFVQMDVVDMVYDRYQDLIYASINSTSTSPHANRIAAINPATLEVVESIYFGPKPTKLVLSPNGRNLFFLLNNNQEIRWLDLATGKLAGKIDVVTSLGRPTQASTFALTPESARKLVINKRISDPYYRSETEVRTLDYSFSHVQSSEEPWSGLVFDGRDNLISWRDNATLSRHTYNGNRFRLESTRPIPVSAGDKYNLANGKLYSSSGFIVNPETLEVEDAIPGERSYYSENAICELNGTGLMLTEGTLYLFDTQTGELLDEAVLNPLFRNDDLTHLFNAGPDRLVLATRFGYFGTITNVPFPVDPPAELVLGPSVTGNLLAIDANAEMLSYDGHLYDLSNYSRVTVYGGEGYDVLTFQGIPEAAETVFINEGSFQLPSGTIDFRINGFETINFSGQDVFDTANVFAGYEANQVSGGPGNLTMQAWERRVQVSETGQILLLGNSQTYATLSGSTGNDRLNASLKTGNLRLIGDGYTLATKNVPNIVVNSISGSDDQCSLVDSDQPDFFTAQGNYFRFTGNGYDFRGRNFDLVTANSDNAGRDRATLKRNPGDSLFQNGGNNMLIGPGYKNNARGFEVLRIE